MSQGTVFLTAAILLVFAIFSVALLWADAQTRWARREREIAEKGAAAGAHVPLEQRRAA